MSKVLSPSFVADQCSYMSDDERKLYQQMLTWQIETDKTLGINSQFLESDGKITYQRDARDQNPLTAFNDFDLQKTQCGIIGLSYTLGLRQLIRGSDHSPKEKMEMLEQLSDMEAEYIKVNNSLPYNQSPELLRQAFIRDGLGTFMVRHGLLINGKETHSLQSAIKTLDNAKNWTGLAMNPYNIETIGSMKHKGEKIGEYKRIETPLHSISAELQREFKACSSNTPPVWFKCLSPVDQQLVLNYQDDLIEGRVIPSQLRSKIPGMKNAFTTSTFVKKSSDDDFKIASSNAHAASSVPVIHKLPDDETLRLTKLTADNLKQALDCEQLTIGTLVSQKGDHALSIVDEMKQSVPNTYYDTRTALMTAAADNGDSVQAFNVCLNNFRYGESDNISNLEKHTSRIQEQLNALTDTPPELKKEIDTLQTHSESLLKDAQSIHDRLDKADTAIKKRLVFVELVRFLVKQKLSPVRKEVLSTVKNELIDRFAATQINAKKIRKALSNIDGDLKGIDVIWRYTRLTNIVNRLKNKRDSFSPSDQAILDSLPKTGLVFGCMSGENRTEHVNHLVSALSVHESLVDDSMSADEKQTLKESVVSQMTDDFHAQLMTGIYGSMPGSIGLRSKSKDSTSTTHYENNALAARKLYLSFADAKSLDRTLIPLREWVEKTRLQVPLGSPAVTDFLTYLNTTVEDTLNSLTVMSRINLDFEDFSKPLQKQYKAIMADCKKGGPFDGLPFTQHPDWRSFREAVTIDSIKKRVQTLLQKKISELPKNIQEKLPPLPIVTKEIASRDTAIQKIKAKLHYLSISNKKTKRPLSEVKHALNELNKTYQKHRFSDKDTLKHECWKQLHSTLSTWGEANGYLNAYKVFLPLCVELGYDAPSKKHNPVMPKMAVNRMLKWLKKSFEHNASEYHYNSEEKQTKESSTLDDAFSLGGDDLNNIKMMKRVRSLSDSELSDNKKSSIHQEPSIDDSDLSGSKMMKRVRSLSDSELSDNKTSSIHQAPSIDDSDLSGSKMMKRVRSRSKSEFDETLEKHTTASQQNIKSAQTLSRSPKNTPNPKRKRPKVFSTFSQQHKSENDSSERMQFVTHTKDKVLINLAQQLKERIVATLTEAKSSPHYVALLGLVDDYLNTPSLETANNLYYGMLQSPLDLALCDKFMQEFAHQAGLHYNDDALIEAANKNVSGLKRILWYVKEHPSTAITTLVAGAAGLAVGGPLAAALVAKSALAAKTALAAKAAIDTAAAAGAAATAAKATKNRNNLSNPLRALLLRIAHCFYKNTVPPLNTIFKMMGGRSLPSIFQRNKPAVVAPESKNNSDIFIRGISTGYPAYSSAQNIVMTLPIPNDGFKDNQTQKITLGIQEDKLTYANVPKGDMHPSHIKSLLDAFSQSGKTRLNLTGCFSNAFKEALSSLNAQREKPFEIVDNTRPEPTVTDAPRPQF